MAEFFGERFSASMSILSLLTAVMLLVRIRFCWEGIKFVVPPPARPPQRRKYQLPLERLCFCRRPVREASLFAAATPASSQPRQRGMFDECGGLRWPNNNSKKIYSLRHSVIAAASLCEPDTRFFFVTDLLDGGEIGADGKGLCEAVAKRSLQKALRFASEDKCIEAVNVVLAAYAGDRKLVFPRSEFRHGYVEAAVRQNEAFAAMVLGAFKQACQDAGMEPCGVRAFGSFESLFRHSRVEVWCALKPNAGSLHIDDDVGSNLMLSTGARGRESEFPFGGSSSSAAGLSKNRNRIGGSGGAFLTSERDEDVADDVLLVPLPLPLAPTMLFGKKGDKKKMAFMLSANDQTDDVGRERGAPCVRHLTEVFVTHEEARAALLRTGTKKTGGTGEAGTVPRAAAEASTGCWHRFRLKEGDGVFFERWVSLHARPAVPHEDLPRLIAAFNLPRSRASLARNDVTHDLGAGPVYAQKLVDHALL